LKIPAAIKQAKDEIEEARLAVRQRNASDTRRAVLGKPSKVKAQ